MRRRGGGGEGGGGGGGKGGGWRSKYSQMEYTFCVMLASEIHKTKKKKMKIRRKTSRTNNFLYLFVHYISSAQRQQIIKNIFAGQHLMVCRMCRSTCANLPSTDGDQEWWLKNSHIIYLFVGDLFALCVPIACQISARISDKFIFTRHGHRTRWHSDRECFCHRIAAILETDREIVEETIEWWRPHFEHDDDFGDNHLDESTIAACTHNDIHLSIECWCEMRTGLRVLKWMERGEKWERDAMSTMPAIVLCCFSYFVCHTFFVRCSRPACA